MITLGIETSTLTGSVALLSDGQVMGEITLSVKVQHSERLMPAVQDLLRDAGVRPSELDLISVAVGPGSFTGLRIGIAAAQGLAQSCGTPTIGISTLEGLARNAVYFSGAVVPVTNAFRGELYWRWNGEDRVSDLHAMVDVLSRSTAPILILGNGTSLCGEALAKTMGQRVQIAPPWLNNPRAVHIASLAAEKFVPGDQAAALLPHYLRNPG